jgi:hypothetical protein
MVAFMDVCMFRWEMWHLRCPVRLATIQYHHSMYNMCKGKVETLYWCTHSGKTPRSSREVLERCLSIAASTTESG